MFFMWAIRAIRARHGITGSGGERGEGGLQSFLGSTFETRRKIQVGPETFDLLHVPGEDHGDEL